MSSKRLNQMGASLRYWKNGIIYAGYNTKMVVCFYVVKDGKAHEIPHSWEYIVDHGIIEAWENLKTFLCENNSLAYDCKSHQIIHYGMLEGI